MNWLVAMAVLGLSTYFARTVCGKPDSHWGVCSDHPKVEFLEDGRKVQLLEDVHYTDPDENVWIAPKGWTVDGASIPQAFWSIIGGPLDGKYRFASVLHDVACDLKLGSWEDVARMFYRAMRCSGVNVTKAKIMYWAVFHYGPRWPAKAVGSTGTTGPTPTRTPLFSPTPTPQISKETVQRVEAWIERENPTIEELEAKETPPK